MKLDLEIQLQYTNSKNFTNIISNINIPEITELKLRREPDLLNKEIESLSQTHLKIFLALQPNVIDLKYFKL